MAKVENGAELVKRLAATGTGEAKLGLLRKVLQDTWKEERRVATSDELLAALEAADGVGEVTLEKARAIADTGGWAGPAAEQAVAVEERLLAAQRAAAEKAAAKK